MNADIQSRRMLPFPENYRASGLLLHLTSLPSPYGIGDVGPTAVKWIDKLSETGQSWWQALPLGPTGYGDSPYQCLSSFAGNGLLISPDLLIEDGLLRASEAASASFSETAVDYPAVISFKRRLLAQAWAISRLFAVRICAWALNNSATSRRIGSKITRSFEP